MTTTRCTRRREQRGVVAVLTAILSLTLFLMAAIVVDLGHSRDIRRQSQNASDASSLAGANALYPSTTSCPSGGAPPCVADAVTAAKLYALNNFQVSNTAWNTCTDPQRPAGYVTAAAGPACISFSPNLSQPTTVRVVAPTRAVRTNLAGMIGVSNVPVFSRSEALVTTGTKCSLCFMGDVNTNNTDFSVSGGSIAVDGDVGAGPNSNWSAISIGVTGTVDGGSFTPPYKTVNPFPDPYASLTLPINTSNTTSFPTRTNPCATVANGGGQGVYGAIHLPNSSCVMQPGVYVITGDWDMTNNTALTSTGGVTLYLKKTGSVDFKNGIVDLTALATGPTAGFVLLADRDNTSSITLQGNGDTGLTGQVYALNAPLAFNGNSCFGFSGGPVVIAGAGSVGNKSCVTIMNAVDATVGYSPPNLSK